MPPKRKITGKDTKTSPKKQKLSKETAVKSEKVKRPKGSYSKDYLIIYHETVHVIIIYIIGNQHLKISIKIVVVEKNHYIGNCMLDSKSEKQVNE